MHGLTRDYVRRVLNHPRKRDREGHDLGVDEDAYRVSAPRPDRQQALRRMFRFKGWPEHRIDAKLREMEG